MVLFLGHWKHSTYSGQSQAPVSGLNSQGLSQVPGIGLVPSQRKNRLQAETSRMKLWFGRSLQMVLAGATVGLFHGGGVGGVGSGNGKFCATTVPTRISTHTMLAK